MREFWTSPTWNHVFWTTLLINISMCTHCVMCVALDTPLLGESSCSCSKGCAVSRQITRQCILQESYKKKMHLVVLCLLFTLIVFTLHIIKANEQTIMTDRFERVCKDETYDTTVLTNFISEQSSRSISDCCKRCRNGCHGVHYNVSSKACYLLSEPASCPPADIKYLCRKQHVQGMVTLLYSPQIHPL